MAKTANAVTENTDTPVVEATAEKKKSIVPAKYSNKYRGKDKDALATFIDDQCSGKDGFEYTAFFELCRKNGIAEEKVAHYEQQVNDNRHGAQGRARMTLRNMLDPIVRKDGKLVGLDGTETPLTLAPRAVSGAAAAAAASKTEEKPAETAPAETAQDSAADVAPATETADTE